MTATGTGAGMGAAHFDFAGKTVLITGASRGIGYAVAKGFAGAGADVHILASGGAVETAADTLRAETGARIMAHVCDIADPSRVRAVIEAVGAAAGAIDILVDNAGYERPTPIVNRDGGGEDTFRRIIDVNVMGTYFVTREALRFMARGARIVITSSIWGKTAVGEFSAYCASKHANIGFMRALARELGPRGIAVNAVCPGWVETEAALRSLRGMAERQNRTPEALLEEVGAAQAFAGLMTPDDMIGAYLFLASSAAANITGQSLNVDRGEVMS